MTTQFVGRFEGMQTLRTLEGAGLRITEALYGPSREILADPHGWATLCLTVAGGYEVDWSGGRLPCGPAALVFHPPGEVYGARISEAGSRCMTVGIAPSVLEGVTNGLPDVGRLSTARRAPPRRLAYQLRREFALGDELSATSVESLVFALLADLGERPCLEARSVPPPWLRRVREQIDDEFRRNHTLANLAGPAGVHRVHLAREFRRCFGCTVGQYIRQRRVEFTCHRLTSSPDSLSMVAFEAGFADQSHMTNTFRKMVGITPGAFRARFLAEA